MMSYYWLSLCVLFVCVQAYSGPAVNISQGIVVGLDDGGMKAFYGIPYAGSASGKNRFKAPTPAPNFTKEFHANEKSKICAQPGTNVLDSVEDCLTLSIFTKDLTTPKPVLVWIYGEEYVSTVATKLSYKGLVEKDVIVVAINYRTSIFGFLCLGVEEAPGNAGLKDIVAGLKWIKENIIPFGGDPNNVVLFGHGSGAALVDLLTLSPMSTNLISKAIVSSGSALAPWAVAYDPVGYAEALGAKLGYTGKDKTSLAEHLIATDISVLIPALEGFTMLNNTALFAPCIENTNLNDTFLVDTPLNILRSGNFNQIPYVTGFVNREGTVRLNQALNQNWLEKMDSNFFEFLPVDLLFSSPDDKESITRKVRRFYFGNEKISKEVIDNFTEYQGDTMFVFSIVKGARERSHSSKAPVRLYQFSYRGTTNPDWPYDVPLTGAKHGNIMNYIFNYDLKHEDANVRESLQKRWAAFAHTSVPVASTVPGNYDWPAINGTHLNYLQYNGDSISATKSQESETIASRPRKQQMEFWKNIYLRHHKKLQPVSGADGLISIVILVAFSQLINIVRY